MTLPAPPAPIPEKAGLVEAGLQRLLFASRWLLAPIYLGLAAGLALLLVRFLQEFWHILHAMLAETDTDLTLGILSLIDLSLLGNLLLMVIFAGYEGFVARLDTGAARLAWMGRVGFGDLKLRLLASIVAISAIHLLEAFMRLDTLSNRELAWKLGLHAAFLVSAVLLAVTDRLAEPPAQAHAH